MPDTDTTAAEGLEPTGACKHPPRQCADPACNRTNRCMYAPPISETGVAIPETKLKEAAKRAVRALQAAAAHHNAGISGAALLAADDLLAALIDASRSAPTPPGGGEDRRIPWPPEPMMYPNAEWCEAYACWHRRHGPVWIARQEAAKFPAPSPGAATLDAQSIADSPAVLGVFAAPEWDELGEDGKAWVRALVNETAGRLQLGSLTREELARLVDPEAGWDRLSTLTRDQRQRGAFERADAILSQIGGRCG